MSDNKQTILKVLVGSQAHGLATPDSDFDYRGVFIVPTEELLWVGSKPKTTNWIEGDEDNTSWELGHFLQLATKCNPTILETFLAPTVEVTEEGKMIQEIFPHIWNSTDVMNAFIGYGHNQRKKFLEKKDKWSNKYACAYLRTLYNAWELLSTNTFTVKVADTEIGEILKSWKKKMPIDGSVIDVCRFWEAKVRDAFTGNPTKETNYAAVNNVLLKIRQRHFLCQK